MLILLALGTGLRQGELLGLRWCDISFKGQELTVNQALKTITEISNDGTRKVKTIIQIPKTKNSLRTVPIPSSLIEKLKEHKAKEENKFKENGISFNDTVFVFTNKFGTYADARALLRSFKRILNRLNLPEKKFHTLRHTFATKLFEADVPLLTVSKLLGHSDIETTEIYTHVMPQQKTRAVDKLNNLFT